MAGDPSKITVWTGYFDSRLPRSAGRRVSRGSSIPQPTLDAVAWAQNKAGIRKTKKQPEASHPSRPFAREGRLILSSSDAMEATGESSKEGILRVIGAVMREQMIKSKQEGSQGVLLSLQGQSSEEGSEEVLQTEVRWAKEEEVR